MAEGQHNVTVQEIDFDGQNEMQSIKDISTIQYEPNFNYLKDNSLGEYLLIEDLKLQPQKEQYQICFYANKEQRNEEEQPALDQIDEQEDEKQKIVTFNAKPKAESNNKKSVRLPKDRKSIEFQLKILQQGIARGYLVNDVDEVNLGQSPYFNDMGVQVGSLHYKKTICKQTNQNNAETEKEAQELIDQSSLHQEDNLNKTEQKYQPNKFTDNDDEDESSQYPESFLSAKIQKQVDEEKPLPKNYHEVSKDLKKSILPALNRNQKKSGTSERIHTENFNTLIYKQPRYFKKEVLKPIESEESEKDQVYYREEEQPYSKGGQQYKTPIFAVEKPKTQRKPIDFQALKRSSEDLGIGHRNIEAMICPQLINKKKIEPLSKKYRPQINTISQIRPSHETKPKVQQRKSPQAKHIPQIKPIHHYQKEDTLSESIMKQEPVTFSTPSPSKSHKPGFIRSHRQKSVQNSQTTNKPSNLTTSRNKDPPIIKILMNNEVNTEISGHLQKIPKELSVSKGVIQINIGDEQSKRSSSLTPYRKISAPQKEYSEYNQNHVRKDSFQSYELGEADKFIDIQVSNLSINFHKKIFGRKYAEILLSPFSYTTDYLHGNHLLWIGKTYLFKRVTPDQTMVITVKCESQFGQTVLGKVHISTTDLLLNHKKSYYETYLTRNDEILAVVILGFETSTRSTINTDFSHRQRVQHAKTQVKEQKSRKSLITSTQNTTKRSKILEKYIHQSKMQRPICSRLNPIRVRKATAGKQDRLRKVSRYISQPLEDFDMQQRYNSHQK